MQMRSMTIFDPDGFILEINDTASRIASRGRRGPTPAADYTARAGDYGRLLHAWN